MAKECIIGREGRNLKFKREALLNYGLKVFFVYSIKSGKKKRIHNAEVIEEIKKEIKRLKN
jgi:hypothetical protein